MALKTPLNIDNNIDTPSNAKAPPSAERQQQQQQQQQQWALRQGRLRVPLVNKKKAFKAPSRFTDPPSSPSSSSSSSTHLWNVSPTPTNSDYNKSPPPSPSRGPGSSSTGRGNSPEYYQRSALLTAEEEVVLGGLVKRMVGLGEVYWSLVGSGG
eukprot:CAMPEP_0182468016 /NCGR_PEP_ID=MMETSP1319-20130603/14849_1 /TAXON_ID=172717 /ORGANISM="Bolidomonas pacifica, Strain RCC208" /LENGTH=153 /DNA_ID=CAMNT_0024668175 /DNA_START=449 /DNA_END=905 /DNA_ORIENTATION=+